MAHYLDTSVVAALLLRDNYSPEAARWLIGSAPTILVSDFCAIEFAAVVSRRVRTKILTHDEARRSLDEFDHWRWHVVQVLQCEREDMTSGEYLVSDLATKLNAPDAIHLAIARRSGATLATFDSRLAEAARRHAVPVVIHGHETTR